MSAGELDKSRRAVGDAVLERSIFSAAHDAVLIMEGDRFIDCNARTEEVMGLPRAQILGRTPWDLSPPHQPGGVASEQAARDAIARAYAGTPHRFEWTHNGPGGSQLNAEVSLNAIQTDGAGLLLAIVRDITDRKRAEQALQDSELRYRRLVEALPDVLFITDEAGECLYASPSLESQTGYSRNEVRLDFGRNMLVPGNDRTSFDSFVQGLLQGEGFRAGPAEHRFVDKQGGTRWYSTIVSKADYEGRKALQFLHRDITKHKESEEALHLSEERFFRAFHATPDALAISSVSDGTVVEINEGFERIFGFSREEVIGKRIPELGIWQDLADRERLFAAALRGEKLRGVEVGFRRKSGEPGIAELNGDMMEAGGKPQILTVVRDITDRKRVESEKAGAFEMIARLKHELELERDYLREEVEVTKFGEIIGISPAMRQVLARIEAVAGTGASVLITGESGVGKELVARAIHARSTRQSKTLVKVNCAAVPKDLFESEFFGHIKGSFTGAHQDRMGRFELADGGTLFLDEVAEIPMELQGKLLRVLQEGEFERIGETRTRRVDVRIISATNRDLHKEMTAGGFRADLYYRLSVFPLEVPPLRERKQDLLPLAVHFLDRVSRDMDRGPFSLTRGQTEAMGRYDWPGNIRELQNVIERAVILSKERRLRLDLPAFASGLEEGAVAVGEDAGGTTVVTAEELREKERKNILAALEQSRWKVSGIGGAAARFGLKPTTLTYRMKVLGIRRPN